MVPVQLVADAVLGVDLVQDLISVLLHGRGEDGDFEQTTAFLEEFLCEGPDMEDLRIVVVMDQCLIQVQNQK